MQDQFGAASEFLRKVTEEEQQDDTDQVPRVNMFLQQLHSDKYWETAGVC